MIRRISREEWRDFLARFSRTHTGWLVTVHGLADAETVARIRGRLQEIRLHGDALQLDLLDGARVYVAHPGELRVQERADGAEWALEASNDRGTLVRAAFRATAVPDEIDGVTAWEAVSPLQ